MTTQPTAHGPLPMLATPFDASRLDRWPTELIVQPKLDGWRAIATRDPQQGYRLTSRTGKPIVSVPHVVEALNRLPVDLPLDGELYVHGQPREYLMTRVSRTVNLHPDCEVVQFHIFDCLDPARQDLRLSELVRTLQGNGPLPHALHLTESTLTPRTDIERQLDYYMQLGYEGLVLRRPDGHYANQRSLNLMKLKPTGEDTYEIVGFQEEVSIHGEPKGALGAFVCRAPDGTVFNVGTGLTRFQRIVYWKLRRELLGCRLCVRYQSKTSSGRPWPGVFVDIVDQDGQEVCA